MISIPISSQFHTTHIQLVCILHNIHIMINPSQPHQVDFQSASNTPAWLLHRYYTIHIHFPYRSFSDSFQHPPDTSHFLLLNHDVYPLNSINQTSQLNPRQIHSVPYKSFVYRFNFLYLKNLNACYATHDVVVRRRRKHITRRKLLGRN